ncbi:MAG TPA: hypothetical protein VIE46_11515 [Gemmatimonadales bacterium]|jgi:hypothetical protein
MRTLGADGHALALVPLLLATAALAPGAPAHAAALHAEIVVTDANGQEIPSLAFLQTRTVGVGLE